MSRRIKRYKTCFVPTCKSTTIVTPEKRFFFVPKRSEIRLKWFGVCGREPGSDNTVFHCCEDHFDLKNDIDNKVEHELTGQPLRLKKGVLPSLFDSQHQHSKRKVLSAGKKTAKKRIREVLNPFLIDGLEDLDKTALPDTEDCNKSVQANFDLYNYAVTQATTDYVLMGFQCSLNEEPNTLHFPIKLELDNTLDSHDKKESYILGLPIKTEFDYLDSQSEIVSDSFKVSESNNEISNQDNANEESCLELRIVKCIESKPKGYIGVPKKQLHLLKFWAKELKTSLQNIYLTLMKIKIHDHFFRIGDEFQISKDCARQIFIQTLPVLESCLKHLIFMPKQINKLCMPLAFRENFLNVSFIMDCLEIEIEEPSDPTQRVLTWNNFIQAHTLKYLVACTPDGCVSFVSKGFGGSTTDKMMVKSSGLLEKVPAGTQIMADRDFKHVNSILARVQCQLVKPPSLETDSPLPVKEVQKGNRIASLKTVVEKVTGRFRDYNMLKPHACINSCLIKHMDSIVNICAGLINLTDDLIKI